MYLSVYVSFGKQTLGSSREAISIDIDKMRGRVDVVHISRYR